MPYENHSTEIMGNLLIPTQSKCPVLSNVRDCHVSLYYILIEKIPNCSHSCLINFNFNRTDFETQCVTSSARRQEPSRIRYLDPDALPSVLHSPQYVFAVCTDASFRLIKINAQMAQSTTQNQSIRHCSSFKSIHVGT